MNKSNKFSPEVRERTVRLVQEHRREYPSLWAAVESNAAKAGPGGVILRVPQGAPPPGASWSWQWSPDAWGEKEILLRGVRGGIEVLKP